MKIIQGRSLFIPAKDRYAGRAAANACVNIYQKMLRKNRSIQEMPRSVHCLRFSAAVSLWYHSQYKQGLTGRQTIFTGDFHDRWYLGDPGISRVAFLGHLFLQ